MKLITGLSQGINMTGLNIKTSSSGVAKLKKLYLKTGIPQEYQEVEWIYKDDGAEPYIDTGIIYDSGCTVEWKFEYYKPSYQWGFFQSDKKRFRHDQSASASASDGTRAVNVGINATSDYRITPQSIVGNTYHLIYTCGGRTTSVIEPSTGYINKVTNVSASQIAWKADETIPIMGYRYKGAMQTTAKYKLYFWKYTDKDGNLIRDFVPCYRKSDNVVGMFDKVTNTFYSNAGTTGTFTVGPNVYGTSYVTLYLLGGSDIPVNQIPISTNADGTIFNGTGYYDEHRISSSGNVSVNDRPQQYQSTCTGFIPCAPGDTVIMKNVYISGDSGSYNTRFYNASFAFVNGMTPSMFYNNITSSMIVFAPYDYDTTTHTLYSFTVPAEPTIRYMRVTLTGHGANAVIYVKHNS